MKVIRSLVAASILAAFACHSHAQIVSRDSLHLQPIGSVVSDGFVLVNKQIPLPAGEFTLVASEIRGAKFVYGDYSRQEHKLVDVYLGQIVDRKLRAAVRASTVLAWGGGRREWMDEPCKRDDTLFKRDQVPFMKKSYAQNCLLVNHLVNSLGSNATGKFAEFARWVNDQGGTTPIPVVLDATVTRIESGEYLAVHYVFNPESYGCGKAKAVAWGASPWHKTSIDKDSAKRRFADSVIEFGKAMQATIDDAFAVRLSRFPVAPSLASC